MALQGLAEVAGSQPQTSYPSWGFFLPSGTATCLPNIAEVRLT